MWQALVDGAAGADAAALSEDFLGVYPSGIATRGEHVEQLRDGPSVLTYSIHDATIRVVSDGAVLLTYLAKLERPGRGPEAMYISSLWEQRGGAWLNVLSQDTVVGNEWYLARAALPGSRD